MLKRPGVHLRPGGTNGRGCGKGHCQGSRGRRRHAALKSYRLRAPGQRTW
jgi:hypothetical protein